MAMQSTGKSDSGSMGSTKGKQNPIVSKGKGIVVTQGAAKKLATVTRNLKK